MTQITASRTLVKSPPELWAECSDATSLARHLGEFGEIHITRLEPETAVAWEGEQFSGTVRLEPSGWGTKVVISARAEPEPPPGIEAPEPPAPALVRGGLASWLFARFGQRKAPPPARSEPAPAPVAVEPSEPSGPEQQLHLALQSLGQAHRRPFSHG